MTDLTYRPPEEFPPSNGPQNNSVNTWSAQQQLVINMDDAQEHHNARMSDYFAWSLWNLFFHNFFCLGFVAAVYSIKSRDHKHLKDYLYAKKYANIALCLNITCLVLFLLSVGGIIYLIIYLTTLMFHH